MYPVIADGILLPLVSSLKGIMHHHTTIFKWPKG